LQVIKQFLLLIAISLAASVVSAESFKLNDGSTVEGDIVLPAKPDGLLLRVGGDKYERIQWEKLSQETLAQLGTNPALRQFTEPFIEVSAEERAKKTEVVIQPVPRLERPAPGGVIAGLFASPVGLLALLLIYAANIYCGYEMAILRAYPVWMGCGAAAIAPIIGPVTFLFLKTKLASAEETSLVEAATASQTHAAGVHENLAAHSAAHPSPHTQHSPTESASPLSLHRETQTDASANHPEPQIFKRGQFTFNKRFIETKFAAFFGVARKESDRDMVLVIKAGRENVTAMRISRMASADMFVETSEGEKTIAFSDIQEITLKHKNT
jgi:hypothetical protein